MIVVANRIPVAKGQGKAFEERFQNRAKKVDGMNGFVRNEILRPIESDYYVILTYWEDQESFMAWTTSEEFKEAHKSRPPVDIFSGPNVFEMHEVIDVSGEK